MTLPRLVVERSLMSRALGAMGLSAGMLVALVPAAAAQEAPAPPASAKLDLATPGMTVRDGVRRARLLRPTEIRVSLRPYVGGERVTVRVLRGARSQLERELPLRRGRDGAGVARTRFTPPSAGTFTIEAAHAATARQTAASASRSFRVVYPSVRAGQRGPGVRLLQRLLARRHYVVSRSGAYDGGTARAVLAFRKVNGMRRTTNATQAVWRRLASGGALRLRYPNAGKHIEVDRSRQVMALVDSRRRYRVYHVSTGARATPTILGRFRFYRKDPGTNSLGMIHSAYFIRGYATHGYKSVPPYPASHGCVRIPPANALTVFRWIRIGDRIDVYR